MTKRAIDRIEDPCPACGSKGFNRIWWCGSMEVSGKFEQSAGCVRKEASNGGT